MHKTKYRPFIKATTFFYSYICLPLVLFACFLVWTQSAQGSKPAKLPDGKLTAAIKIRLSYDKAIDAHDIEVTSKKGIVTLKGEVRNLLSKRRATKVAVTLKGVRAVNNRLKVNTPKRDDETLRKAIDTAMAIDPASDSYQVKVYVKNGHVVLRGKADSFVEKQLAETLAMGVVGVRSVTNYIKLSLGKKRLDSEIKKDILARLRWNAWIDEGLINVKVEKSRVKLSGVVGSAVEKDRAYAAAWVAGVIYVDKSGLYVQWWMKDKIRRTRRYIKQTDTQIQKTIKQALKMAPNIKDKKIRVSTTSGVVSLMGQVENLRERKAAAKLAKTIRGVWHVKNFLRVNTNKKITDKVLATRLSARFLFDPYLYDHRTRVVAHNGEVSLYGVVDSSFARDRAAMLATSTRGVKTIRNFIKVRKDAGKKSDLELWHDVQQELFWSPFVDSTDIKIKTNNGMVTLKGEVDSWREYLSASNNAYRAGAKLVLNQLKLNIPTTQTNTK